MPQQVRVYMVFFRYAREMCILDCIFSSTIQTHHFQFDACITSIYNIDNSSEPRQFECKCVAIYIREEEAKRIPNNRYRNHVYMNDDIFVNFFGEKPHRDETLAESRWGLNRVTEK